MRIDRLRYTIATGFAYFDAPGVLGEMSAAQYDLIPVVGEAITLWGVRVNGKLHVAESRSIIEDTADDYVNLYGVSPRPEVFQLIAYERKA